VQPAITRLDPFAAIGLKESERLKVHSNINCLATLCQSILFNILFIILGSCSLCSSFIPIVVSLRSLLRQI